MRRFACILAVACFCLPAARPAAAEEPVRVVEDVLDVGDSTWIESAVYRRELDSDRGMLTVQMNGEKYTYIDVPLAAWVEFKGSDSKGRHYGEHIRNRYEREPGEPLWKSYDSAVQPPAQAFVQCAFNEDCEPLVLRYIDSAQESVLMAAYAFTRTRIAAALVSAKVRGADVRVKIDSRQAEYPLAAKQLAYLERNGIPVQRIVVRGEYAAMHNKFVVVDRRFVITGSYNYTTTADVSNWENVLWTDSPEIAARYAEAWEAISSEQAERP